MQSILDYNNNIESTNYNIDDDVKIDFSSNYETISGFESVVYIPYQVKPGDRIFKVYTKKHLIDNQAKWLIHNKFLVNTYGCKFININGNNPCLTMYYVSVDLLMAIFIQSKIVNNDIKKLSFSTCIYLLIQLGNKFVLEGHFISDLMSENLLLGECGFIILDGGGYLPEEYNDPALVETQKKSVFKTPNKTSYVLRNRDYILSNQLCSIQLIRILGELIYSLPEFEWILYGLTMDDDKYGFNFVNLLLPHHVENSQIQNTDINFKQYYNLLQTLNQPNLNNPLEVIQEIKKLDNKLLSLNIKYTRLPSFSKYNFLENLLLLFYNLNNVFNPLSLVDTMTIMFKIYQQSGPLLPITNLNEYKDWRKTVEKYRYDID